MASDRALPMPATWAPNSEVRCSTKERSPSALAAYNHDELSRFLRRTSDRPTLALLEAAALCDRELGVVVAEPAEPRRCDGCARCAHRKCPTTPARGRRP